VLAVLLPATVPELAETELVVAEVPSVEELVELDAVVAVALLVDDAKTLSRSIGFSSRAMEEPSGTWCVTPLSSWYPRNWLGGTYRVTLELVSAQTSSPVLP
jgi:hypothetical protein